MSNQYMTPWRVVQPEGDQFVYIMNCNDEQEIRQPKARRETVERIVACMNVCEGIADSALNAFTDFEPLAVAQVEVTESEGGEL